MKKIIIAIFILVASAATFAAGGRNLSSREETKRLSDDFMKKISDGQIGPAFESIRPYFPLPDNEFAVTLDKTVKQLATISVQYGRPAGYELVKEEMVGTSLVKYTYLQKFEKNALRWSLLFYGPGNRWQINNLNWDSKIRKLFPGN